MRKIGYIFRFALLNLFKNKKYNFQLFLGLSISIFMLVSISTYTMFINREFDNQLNNTTDGIFFVCEIKNQKTFKIFILLLKIIAISHILQIKLNLAIWIMNF